jgi:SAM-dependent MidA family methyltransferase
MQPGGRPRSSSPLPEADAEAQAHSARLTAAIRRRMDRHGGALPFDLFMEMALYAPGLGYYMAGSPKLGSGGDFVTAPEVSPLFGRCLAAQCAEVIGALGAGDLLELGAGSGRLATDLLPEMERLGSLPGRYLILEPSAELRDRQRRAVARLPEALAARVRWLEGLPRGFRGVVLANEVLDAMPVHRFRVEGDRISEVFVRWGGEGFVESLHEPATPTLAGAVRRLIEGGIDLPSGYASEINLRLGPWVEALGEVMAAGVALLIDYGYPRREYYLPERRMGTLMCHYRHRAHADPYRLVGLQDVTAHVDFSAAADAARRSGLTVAGFATQAHFLLGCGLERFLAASDPGDVLGHSRLVQGAKRLVLPGEMGERFKVLALGRGLTGPLMGFSVRDLRDRL